MPVRSMDCYKQIIMLLQRGDCHIVIEGHSAHRQSLQLILLLLLHGIWTLIHKPGQLFSRAVVHYFHHLFLWLIPGLQQHVNLHQHGAVLDLLLREPAVHCKPYCSKQCALAHLAAGRAGLAHAIPVLCMACKMLCEACSNRGIL